MQPNERIMLENNGFGLVLNPLKKILKKVLTNRILYAIINIESKGKRF